MRHGMGREIYSEGKLEASNNQASTSRANLDKMRRTGKEPILTRMVQSTPGAMLIQKSTVQLNF